ncbi:Enoyl-CoA hydratase AFT3-1 [Fusarium oxysporum f. sp. albedinis]|nr:Enoyl-CoA hydratase AFT3-1 [Fusarium oxysporum f. sp. albedinis]
MLPVFFSPTANMLAPGLGKLLTRVALAGLQPSLPGPCTPCNNAPTPVSNKISNRDICESEGSTFQSF